MARDMQREAAVPPVVALLALLLERDLHPPPEALRELRRLGWVPMVAPVAPLSTMTLHLRL